MRTFGIICYGFKALGHHPLEIKGKSYSSNELLKMPGGTTIQEIVKQTTCICDRLTVNPRITWTLTFNQHCIDFYTSLYSRCTVNLCHSVYQMCPQLTLIVESTMPFMLHNKHAISF